MTDHGPPNPLTIHYCPVCRRTEFYRFASPHRYAVERGHPMHRKICPGRAHRYTYTRETTE